MSNYLNTIGIEVHVELKTNTKIFSNSANGYGKSANSLINLVDLGYPGTLPTLNKEVIRLAIKACKVLNCKIRREMYFDRKNYFYPDNPKNYQITQNRTPIGYDGYVEIEIDGKKRKIEIEEMHIEEDTCKSTHRKNVTLLDFNRAGVPLIEIVTKPCIKTPEEAKLYIEKLKSLLLYANISDCKMEEGSMRCDANISIRKKESDPFGTKVEIKNIGSINNVKISLEKEKERQISLLEAGKTFEAQTRRFDNKKNDTVLMRIKETGNDYRYFPEPDIPKLVLTESEIEKAIKEIPMLPDERQAKYKEKGISDINIKKLIQNKLLSDYLNNLLDSNIDFKIASNLLLGDISKYLNEEEKTIYDTKLSKEKFIDLINKISDKTLTNKNIKDILNKIMEEDSSIEEILKSSGIQNIKDEGLIETIVQKVIDNNPESVEDYLNGHERTMKFLMGQIMKETKGSVNPAIASSMLKQSLEKRK